MELLEVFKDFQIIVEGKGFFCRYTQTFKVEPKEDHDQLTIDKLKDYVRDMQKRYPEKEFKLATRTVNGKKYYIITRKSYEKDDNGKIHRVWKRVPIYFDLEEQKAYVPKYYVRTRPKLVNYICMVTLGALGLSQSKYVR
jgi:hypothetical protein